MIADRNHVAVAMLFAIPLMNWLRLQSPHRIIRIGLILAMVATLFGAIGTQSRGALVAMVGVGFLLWLRTPGKLVSGIAIVGAVAAVLAFMPASWTERMHTIENFEEDTSAMGRVRIWQVSFDIARARPLIGGGFRAMYSQDIVDKFDPLVRARAAHSIYFEALGEQGFVVFGIWLAIIATGVLYSFRLIALARDRPELRWAADLGRMSQVSIAAYLAGGAFLSLAYWDVFWTLLIVLGATYALALRTVREGKAPVSASAARAVPTVTGGWRGRPAAARAAP
jgi:probable O-glycosylation ligase (exosortase A-associated)